jgi:hypothetical protein
MATPATTHAARNIVRVDAVATRTTATTPTTDPAVMIMRGPRASRRRPTNMPHTPETIRPVENAAVRKTGLHPVSSAMGWSRTAKA